MAAEADWAGLIKSLTPGERQIAELVALGMSNEEVAAQRYVSTKTVEFHLTRIYRKLGLRSRAQLVFMWSSTTAADTSGGSTVMLRADDQRLVGRDQELARLYTAVELAESSAPVIVLMGEAGIGKSMLLASAVNGQVAAGAVALVMECEESPHSTLKSFDQLLQCLRSAGVHDGGDARRDVSYVAEKISVLARDRRVLLVCDDLHWASEPLMQKLLDLMRLLPRRGVATLFTTRSAEHKSNPLVAEFLAHIRRRGYLERLVLNPFDEFTVRELASDVFAELRDSDLAAMAAKLHRATAGIPLYVVESLRVLAAASDPTSPVDLAELVRDSSIQDVLANQLIGVGSSAQHLLEVGSLIGDEFDLTSVAAAVDVDRVSAARALSDAVTQGLVVGTATTNDVVYRFRHSLVREASRGRLTGTDELLLHVQIARTLASLDPTDIERISHHYALAGAAADPTEVLPWATAAADTAGQAVRPTDACRHLESACGAAARRRPRDDASVVELECRLARAAALAALPDVMDLASERAASAARRLGHEALLAEVALAGAGLVRMGGDHSAAIRLVEEALGSEVSEAQSVALESLRVRLICASGGDPPAASDVARLVHRARATSDAQALSRALLAQCWASGCSASGPELGHAADELVALTVAGPPNAAAVALAMKSWSELVCGGPNIEEIWANLEHVSTRGGVVQQAWVMTPRRALHELAGGDAFAAKRLLDDTPPELRPAPDAIATHQLATVIVGSACGDDVRELAGEVATSVIGPLVYALTASVHAAQGDFTATRQAVEDLKERNLLDRQMGPGARWNLAALADTAIVLEDRDLAERLYMAGISHSGLGATFLSVFSAGPIDRWLARLAAFLGYRQRAEHHLRLADEFIARTAADLWRAEVLLDRATIETDSRMRRRYAHDALVTFDRGGFIRSARNAAQLLEQSVHDEFERT